MEVEEIEGLPLAVSVLVQPTLEIVVDSILALDSRPPTDRSARLVTDSLEASLSAVVESKHLPTDQRRFAVNVLTAMVKELRRS